MTLNCLLSRITTMRENGIYSELQRIALNPLRIGPDVREKQRIISHECEVLVISQLKGIFFLYLIFTLISILMFVIECVKVKQKPKPINRRRARAPCYDKLKKKYSKKFPLNSNVSKVFD